MGARYSMFSRIDRIKSATAARDQAKSPTVLLTAPASGTVVA
jgi:Na+-transporting NADH:ubiquinone oxidoreductase subunit NqrA